MGWIEMLAKTYDACSEVVGKEINDEPVLLPIAHSTANAQIEITVDMNGNFIRELSEVVEKNEGNEITIIPVTEDSASRGAGNFPHALCDKLCYVAGDYSQYTGEQKEEYFEKYLEGVKRWDESEYTHPWVHAICEYVKKKNLIGDLISCGLLMPDETGYLSDKDNKIHQLSQRDAFIRFAVCEADGSKKKLWKSQELYDLYAQFYTNAAEGKYLCYVSGLEEICTEKHPSKIRNTGDKAKLISGNDESGFTYRGRFEQKGDAVSVGYVTSQKAHNALRWLLKKQGYLKDGSAVVVWGLPGKLKESICEEHLLEVPDIFSDSLNAFCFDWEEEETEDMLDVQEAVGTARGEEMLDTGRLYARLLKQAMQGYYSRFDRESAVIIMAVDAATTGRLSIIYYHEFAGNDFIDRVIYWHQHCTWKRNVKIKSSGKYVWVTAAPSPREIALAAFGTERGNGYLDCDAKLLKSTVQRILPCIVGLVPKIPKDIVRSAVNRASRPEAYSSYVWKNHVLAVTCAMIKYNQYGGELDMMELDKNRDVLFGRLLAIMEAMEQRAMYDPEDRDKDKRMTNAKKLWNMYTRRPAKTYDRLYSKMIQAYAAKLTFKTRNYYEAEISAIMNILIGMDEFSNKPLKEEYLLGYYAQMEKMRPSKKQESEGGNE